MGKGGEIEISGFLKAMISDESMYHGVAMFWSPLQLQGRLLFAQFNS